MNLSLNKNELFLAGMSFTGGSARFGIGTVNKFLDKQGGLKYTGTNLYIEGQEVIITPETLAYNNLYEQWMTWNDEQRKWFMAGMIAGMYQPMKKEDKWAYLTFRFNSDDELDDEENMKVYKKDPRSDIALNRPLSDFDSYPPPIPDPSPFPFPDPILPIIWDPIYPPEPVLPSGGKYHFEDNTDYIIIREDPSPSPIKKAEMKGKVITEEQKTEVDEDEPHGYDEYEDPETGEEMCMIVLTDKYGNKIIIRFKREDKLPNDNWFKVGAMINMEGVPASGWYFNWWIIDGEAIEENPHDYLVIQNYEIGAKFSKVKKPLMEGYHELVMFLVSGRVNNPSYGSILGLGEYYEDNVITLKAQLRPGCRVIQWTVDGEVVSTSEVYSFLLDGDKDVYLELEGSGPIRIDASDFIELAEFIIANASEQSENRAEADDVVSLIDYVTIIKTRKGTPVIDCSDLLNIIDTIAFTKKHVNKKSINCSDNIEVSDEIDTKQRFSKVISGSTDGHGSIRGLGTYIEDTLITLEGMPDQGYSVDTWYINEEAISTETSIRLLVEDDTEVYLTFKDGAPVIIIPYIEDGLTDCFDSLLNTQFDHKDVKVWKNLKYDPQPDIPKDKYGYASTNIAEQFDGIDNIRDEHSDTSKLWKNILYEDPDIEVDSLGYVDNYSDSFDGINHGSGDDWINRV